MLEVDAGRRRDAARALAAAERGAVVGEAVGGVVGGPRARAAHAGEGAARDGGDGGGEGEEVLAFYEQNARSEIEAAIANEN